jgi:riboflavin biosynthesis pyrimidine reductase
MPPPPHPDASGADPFAPYDAPRPRPDGRPWLLANMVAGLDGSLSWHGRVGELSSASDRSLFVRLRGLADAVLVGAGTVRAEGYGPVRLPDDVQARRVAEGRPPVPPLVVVSRSLDLDWSAPLWSTADGPRPVVVTSNAAPAEAVEAAAEHAEVVLAGAESVDLGAALAHLAGQGKEVLVTEGGPTLLDELVGARLLDELCLTLTPRFGGDPLTMANRAAPAAELAAFSLAGVVRQGDELYLRYLRRADQADDAQPDDRQTPHQQTPHQEEER